MGLFGFSMAIKVCAQLTDEIFDVESFVEGEDVTVTNEEVTVVDSNDDVIRGYRKERVIWWENE